LNAKKRIKIVEDTSPQEENTGKTLYIKTSQSAKSQEREY